MPCTERHFLLPPRSVRRLLPLLCACLIAAGRLGASPAEAVLEWNERCITEMKRDTLFPAIVARNLAILHTALQRGFEKDPECSERVARLIGFKVAYALLPAHAAVFEDYLDTDSQQARVTDAEREFADACVRPVLEGFGTDGSSSHVTYMSRTAQPGAWCRTPPFFRAPELAHWPKVRPILLESARQFRPAGPPQLDSNAYADALREVQQWGGRRSARRTGEQAECARFWSDFSYTETPVGHWNSIARVVMRQRPAGGPETARLFYVLNVALSDAAIACWDAKYAYDSWRPLTAIQRADEDGNPRTLADPEWLPLLNTPSHPEYVSGHSAFSGAAAGVLRRFLGTDQISFEVSSDTLPGTRRRFTSLSGCAKECGESRIYGGIHFRFSCEDGLRVGEEVAGWTWGRLEAGKR